MRRPRQEWHLKWVFFKNDDHTFSRPGKELGIHFWYMMIEQFSLDWKKCVLLQRKI